MKKTDLDKHQGKKVTGRMKQEATGSRRGPVNGSAVADRKEQRRRDQGAGLVPFAVKLPQDMVGALQALARERSVSLDTLVADLLRGAIA